MIITDINLKRIDPSEGMRLTNGTDIAEGSVYLGVGDSADNWYEITAEEAEKIMAEREAELLGEEASP
jgi:hypothetical protein